MMSPLGLESTEEVEDLSEECQMPEGYPGDNARGSGIYESQH